MIEIPFLAPIITILAIVVAIFIGLKIVKKVVMLVINGFLGIVALLALNLSGYVTIPVNIWTILTAIFGGIPGVLILAALQYFGIAF